MEAGRRRCRSESRDPHLNALTGELMKGIHQ